MSSDRDRPVRSTPLRLPRRRVGRVLTTTGAVLGLVVVGLGAGASVAPTTAVQVDFGRVVAEVPASHIGFTATTFGVDGGPVVKHPADLALLGALGAGTVRIHLTAGDDGQVVSGAAGGDRGIAADEWLEAYTGLGLRPVVVLDLDVTDAVAVLTGLRQGGHDVDRVVLGNEFDANSRADVAPGEYVRRFREVAAALRALDPGLEIGGPAPASYDALSDEVVTGIVEAPPAERASFIDYHAYGAGEGETATPESAWRYADQIRALRARLAATPDVGIQVGEFNLNWADEPQNGTPVQTAWVAAALGTILAEGAVAILYGDRNEAMGLVGGGEPKASYWGVAMLTGAGRFRGLGERMVWTASTDPALRVFASADGKTVVLVNTGDAAVAAVTLDGFGGGSAEIWQSTDGAPVRLPGTAVDRTLTLRLPSVSVTTVVLDETAAPS